MGKSGTFDNDTGEIAPQTGEFLAGVLALARISRVTVALESGHGAGAALLAAARLTGHAETCLLFDRWDGDPTAALSAALLETDPEFLAGDSPAPQTPLQLLHAMQARRRQSFLLIFDRFEQYLTQSADPARSAGFDRAFVRMVSDSTLDVRVLLVLDEAAEDMLERFQNAIPGIGDGCLRIPAGGLVRSQADAPTQPGSNAARRDRSFGMLLERLTAITPADEANASQLSEPHALREVLPAPADAPPRDAFVVEEVQPEIRLPDAPLQSADVAAPAVPAAAAAPEMSAAITPLPAARPEPARGPSPQPVAAAAPRRTGKTAAILLSVMLALGAGIYAYRQQAPDTPRPAAAPAVAASATAPTPSTVTPPQQPASLGPALLAAPALAEAAPKPATPAAPVAASAAATRPATTVHVHVRNQRERDRVQAVARTLAVQGIRVVDVKVMSKGPSVADLRYFRDEDREEAVTVQKALRAAGVAVPRLSRMNGFESVTRPHQFEVWLSGENTIKPAATPARR